MQLTLGYLREIVEVSYHFINRSTKSICDIYNFLNLQSTRATNKNATT